MASKIEMRVRTRTSALKFFEVVYLLKPLEHKYYELGVQLDIETDQLKRIEAQYSSVSRRFSETIELGQKKDKNCSWSALADAIERVGGQEQLVRELRAREVDFADNSGPDRGCSESSEDTGYSTKGECASGDSSGPEVDYFEEIPGCGCDESCSAYTYCREGCPKPTLSTGGVVRRRAEGRNVQNVLPKENSEHENYTEEFERKTRKMQIQFARLVNDLCHLLIVTISELTLYLQNAHPVLKPRIDEMSKATCLEQVFRIVTDQACSWFDYEVIKDIVDYFGKDPEREKLEQYEANFKMFAHQRLPKGKKHIEVGSGARKGGKQLVIKIDKEWNVVNFNDLDKIRENLASILKVNKKDLYLADIREGCIMMKFMVTEELARRLFPKKSSHTSSKLCSYLTPFQIKSLRDEGVILFICGHVSWRSAAEQKEPKLLCSKSSDMALQPHMITELDYHQLKIGQGDEFLDLAIYFQGEVEIELGDKETGKKTPVQDPPMELLSFGSKSFVSYPLPLTAQSRARKWLIWSAKHATVAAAPSSSIATLQPKEHHFSSVIEVKGLICAGKNIHDTLIDATNSGVDIGKYMQECQLISDFRHPNIIQFLRVCSPNTQHPVLVMERKTKKTIPNVLLALKHSMLVKLAMGLLYLHTHDLQIIHRKDDRPRWSEEELQLITIQLQETWKELQQQSNVEEIQQKDFEMIRMQQLTTQLREKDGRLWRKTLLEIYKRSSNMATSVGLSHSQFVQQALVKRAEAERISPVDRILLKSHDIGQKLIYCTAIEHCDAEASTPNLPLVSYGQSSYPGCNRPKYRDTASGRIHDYFGTHARALVWSEEELQLIIIQLHEEREELQERNIVIVGLQEEIQSGGGAHCASGVGSPATFVEDKREDEADKDGNRHSQPIIFQTIKSNEGIKTEHTYIQPNKEDCGEAPAISDDENDKAVQDDAYKDSPAYRNGNQDIKPEFQRMDYLPHQREHDTEPSIQWYPSEEQRAKREGLKELDLNSKPAMKEFMNRVAVHIPHKWMEIGIQLDIPRGHLEAFNQRHLGQSMKILVEVFNYWENQSGDKPKTWYTVIDALKTPLVGEHTLASDLESLQILLPAVTDSNNLAHACAP